MLMMIEQRDTVEKKMDICTKANIEYTKALIDAGAEIIVISDPIASPDLISPKDFSSIVKPELKKLSQSITSKGAIGVLHICGEHIRS